MTPSHQAQYSRSSVQRYTGISGEGDADIRQNNFSNEFRALVGNDDLVVVRRGHLDGRAMERGPVLLLAEVEQHAVDALLRAGTGI